MEIIFCYSCREKLHSKKEIPASQGIACLACYELKKTFPLSGQVYFKKPNSSIQGRDRRKQLDTTNLKALEDYKP